MAVFLKLLLASIPKILIGILAKILTEKFMQQIIEDLLIYCAEKAAANTESNIDDQFVVRIKETMGRAT